jgi:ABC-type transport system involved in cytochrome bd biosynthesis fused ATPase/permease subunit
LLVALKAQLAAQAFYWPTNDKLAFAFAGSKAAARPAADDENENDEELDSAAVDAVVVDAKVKTVVAAPIDTRKFAYAGFSSGERQLKSLSEIAAKTAAHVYLLDEWDANLDAGNRAAAELLVAGLAARAVVVEISHRDRV